MRNNHDSPTTQSGNLLQSGAIMNTPSSTTANDSSGSTLTRSNVNASSTIDPPSSSSTSISIASDPATVIAQSTAAFSATTTTTTTTTTSLDRSVVSSNQLELNHLAESFRRHLARLRRLVESLDAGLSHAHSESDSARPARSELHEQLAQSLRVLRTLFEHHPSFQCAPLLLAAGDLIQAVKTAAANCQSTYDEQLVHAIDKLAVLFGTRPSSQHSYLSPLIVRRLATNTF